MNTKKYLTMKAEWTPADGRDNDFRVYNYLPPSTIPVFKYAKMTAIRSNVGYQFVNAMVYVSDNPNINVGDLLDGFVVQEVSKYFDFNGNDNFGVFEYMCW